MSQSALKFANSENFSFDDFLISDCNRDALMLVEKDEKWPSSCLVIYGPKHSGKTYLSHIWYSFRGALFLDGGSFNIEDINSDGYYIVEDIEKVVDEEKLFHLFNLINEGCGKLLLTSGKELSSLSFALPDLMSRVNASFAVSLGAPDDDLLRAVVVKKFADRQLRVERAVVDYIVPRIERSFYSVHQCVDMLDKTSMRQRRNITVPFIRECFESAKQDSLLSV